MQFKQESLAALCMTNCQELQRSNIERMRCYNYKKNMAVQSRSLSTRHGNADSGMDIGRSARQEECELWERDWLLSRTPFSTTELFSVAQTQARSQKRELWSRMSWSHSRSQSRDPFGQHHRPKESQLCKRKCLECISATSRNFQVESLSAAVNQGYAKSCESANQGGKQGIRSCPKTSCQIKPSGSKTVNL